MDQGFVPSVERSAQKNLTAGPPRHGHWETPMKFNVGKDPTNLLKAPSDASEIVRPLAPGTPLGEAALSEVDGRFIKVDLGGGEDDKGFVLKSDCVQDAGERPKVARRGVVQKCVVAEMRRNAEETTDPWYVSADYLIARGIIETGVTNAGPMIPGSDAVGPMQVSTSEWGDFQDKGGGSAGGFIDLDRDDPIRQIDAAAFRMHQDMAKMNDLRVTAGKASKSDPFVSSYLDVLFAYLTDSPAAALALLDARTGTANQSDPITKFLNGPLTAPQVSALLKARSKFFGSDASPKSLKDAVTGAETALNDGLKQAFDDISNFIPEAIPAIAAGGAPWFTKAKEMEGKVEEGKQDALIVSFFDATDISPKPATSKTPWCGAFAAFCMRESGNTIAAASIPKGAAAAVSWKGWGAGLSQASDKIPQGAVVVLSKAPNTEGTGHVGFFVKFSDDGNQVFLLGGNQSNKVCTAPFPKDRIAGVRWLDLAPAADAVGFHLPNDIPAARGQFADLIVAEFAAAGYGKNQQIAALANAIAESRLDPASHALGEDSVGLFQLRRIKGVGQNFSVEQLSDPKFNTELIIAEAKKVPLFASAETLEKAVDVFVRSVERPANKDAEVAKRTDIAHNLLA
jgi:uncharacterized protein (TIGR02594 family)